MKRMTLTLLVTLTLLSACASTKKQADWNYSTKVAAPKHIKSLITPGIY